MRKRLNSGVSSNATETAQTMRLRGGGADQPHSSSHLTLSCTTHAPEHIRPPMHASMCWHMLGGADRIHPLAPLASPMWRRFVAGLLTPSERRAMPTCRGGLARPPYWRWRPPPCGARMAGTVDHVRCHRDLAPLHVKASGGHRRPAWPPGAAAGNRPNGGSRP